MSKRKKEPAKKGRPSSFREEFVELAFNYCLLGAIDKELAVFFDVNEATLNRWKIEFPHFCESITRGRAQADANVASRLYQRAMGYSHPEEKIFCCEGAIVRAQTTKHYPPDTVAGMFWLRNRRKSDWRQRPDEAGSSENNSNIGAFETLPYAEG